LSTLTKIIERWPRRFSQVVDVARSVPKISGGGVVGFLAIVLFVGFGTVEAPEDPRTGQ